MEYIFYAMCLSIYTRDTLMIMLILSSLFGCHNTAFAQDDFDLSFDLDDTGQSSGESELNYVDLWPTKIVLDTSRNQFKLVWFDTDPPRHTDIQLDDISRLQLVPSFSGHIPELQIHLKDGRDFLLDKGASSRKTAQTFAALARVPIQDDNVKIKRIVPKTATERGAPILVIGDLTGPDVLTPPSTTKIVTAVEEVQSENTFDNSTLMSAAERSTVDITVKSNMSRFRSCYVKESRKFPNLSGRIDVKFTLNADGTVKETSIASSSLKSPLVEKCVQQQLMGLQFEPQKEEVQMVYPFVFTKQ